MYIGYTYIYVCIIGTGVDSCCVCCMDLFFLHCLFTLLTFGINDQGFWLLIDLPV